MNGLLCVYRLSSKILLNQMFDTVAHLFAWGIRQLFKESHSSENSRILIGYLGEVFSTELRLLKACQALRDMALERQ